MELTPLSLVGTDELMKELKGRFDACLIVTLRQGPDVDAFWCEWTGLTTCIGLANRAEARMLQVALSHSEDIEGHEH